MAIRATGNQRNDFNLSEIQEKIDVPVFPESHTTFPNTITIRRQEISKSGYLKKFINQDLNDPLRIEVSKSRWNSLVIENLTNDRIVVPHQELLVEKASHYHLKYGISIVVAENERLVSSLTLIKASLTQPTYIGIIVCYGGIAANHVTPVLAYLNPNEEAKDEYLVLDSTGNDHHLLGLFEVIASPGKIYTSIENRQADSHSCRTDAIAILRNALLSLKFHERKDGFGDALQDAVVNENRLEHLPPEWDYTAQISNKQDRAFGTRVLRNLYSNDPAKRSKVEHVAEFRIRNSAFATFSCLLTSGSRRLEKEELKRWQALPASSQLKVDETGPVLEFGLTRFVNTYLVTKSLKWI